MNGMGPPLGAGIDPGLIKVLIVVVIVVVTLVGKALAKLREGGHGPAVRPHRGVPPNPPPKPARPHDPNADVIGVILRKAAERRAQAQQKARPAGPPARGRAPRPETARPALAQRAEAAVEPVLLEATPDRGVAAHVRQRMAPAGLGQIHSELGQEVAQAGAKIQTRLHSFFDHQISQVSEIPGEAAEPPAAAAPSSPSFPPTAAAGLAVMLAHPVSLRQAILAHEILQRPEHRWT